MEVVPIEILHLANHTRTTSKRNSLALISCLFLLTTKFGEFTRTACWSQWRQTKHGFACGRSHDPSCGMIQLDLICQYGHSFGGKLLLHGVQMLSAYLDHFEFRFAPMQVSLLEIRSLSRNTTEFESFQKVMFKDPQ